MTAEPNSYLGARVVVLGATGFIGRWVTRALRDAGAEVHLVARAAGLDAAGGSHPHDLTDLDGTRALIRRLAPAVVFNLAGYGVDPAEKREGDAARAGVLNAELPAAVATALAAVPSAWPGARLVHAGSILEYGPIGGALREDRAPRPAGLYAETKLAGTLALADQSRRTGLRAVTARLAQVYGPGEQEGRLLPALLAARRTGRLEPLSAGTQRKDFTYVEDVAAGLLVLGRQRPEPGEVVNLATGRLTTVRDFALEAARVLPLDPGLLRFERPVPAGELEHDPVPIDRLRELTGWVPPTGIAEGIRRTIGHERAS